MWPWKKRKPENPEERTQTPRDKLVPPPMMGYVARLPQPREDKPEEPEEKPHDPLEGIIESGIMAPGDWEKQREEKDGDEGTAEGTSNASASVRAGMNPHNTPRPNAFDPSKVAANSLISLQSVQIATPCRADWSKMEGDDKSRFCQSCQKSVYNLSAMTTPEAQALIEEKQGNLCARIYRRADGTIITGDCPVGTTVPRRAFWGAGLAAIFGAMLSGCGANAAGSPGSSSLDSLRSVPVLGVIVNLLSPQPQVQVTAGGISIAPPSGGEGGKPSCPLPTATPKGTTAPTEEPEALMGDVATVAVKPHALMGRVAPPKRTPTPVPTEEPGGQPEMGEAAPTSAGA